MLLEVELITLTMEERTEKEEKYMNFFILYFFFLVRNDDYGCRACTLRILTFTS